MIVMTTLVTEKKVKYILFMKILPALQIIPTSHQIIIGLMQIYNTVMQTKLQ